MLAKGNTWKWKTRKEQAFHKLKEAVTQAPRLFPPDYTKPFILQTDASEIGVGAVIFQREETPTNRQIIRYASRKLKHKPTTQQ